ncbi:hypothetical protein M0802_015606 [Mischocyttarus mexicanus]|nr:hypothetical protein M0802_015606 [Mischocyttarus mexicanus]
MVLSPMVVGGGSWNVLLFLVTTLDQPPVAGLLAVAESWWWMSFAATVALASAVYVNVDELERAKELVPRARGRTKG